MKGRLESTVTLAGFGMMVAGFVCFWVFSEVTPVALASAAMMLIGLIMTAAAPSASQSLEARGESFAIAAGWSTNGEATWDVYVGFGKGSPDVMVAQFPADDYSGEDIRRFARSTIGKTGAEIERAYRRFRITTRRKQSGW